MTKENQQGVPDGSALQIEAAVIQAQKVLSDWNEWYGLNGCNAPLPPSGIVKAQEMLSEARSLLASAPPAPQAKPQPLSDEQIKAMCKQTWVFETVKQWVRIIEAAHGIKE